MDCIKEESMTEDDEDFDEPSTSCSAAASRRRSNVLTSVEVQESWNLVKLYEQCKTREGCIEFAEEEGLILSSKECRTHRKKMQVSLTGNNTVGTFRCRRGVCRTKTGISRARGTCFENAKLSLPQIFYLMYAYASHWTQAVVRKEDFVEGSVLSSVTICEWYNYCRSAVVLYQTNQAVILGEIGGPGKVVQLDVIEFGRSRHKRERGEERQWVLGMLEDGSEDIRMEVCSDRSVEALLPLIKKNVRAGTIIHTDSCKEYDCLTDYGYKHRKQNNKIDPLAMKCVSQPLRIQAQLRTFKSFCVRSNIMNATNFTDMLIEYIWRTKIAHNHDDPFVKLLEAIKYTYKN